MNWGEKRAITALLEIAADALSAAQALSTNAEVQDEVYKARLSTGGALNIVRSLPLDELSKDVPQ